MSSLLTVFSFSLCFVFRLAFPPLADIERDGLDNIIGWLPHGRSFKIHNQKEFVEQILPKYFV